MILTREQILSAQDIETREVEAPEWGGSVLVRALNHKEATEWRRSLLRPVTKVDPKTKQTAIEMEFSQEAAEQANLTMLALALVDESGNRLFTKSDIEALGQKSIAPVIRIVRVVMELSGLSEKAEENAAKNSAPNQSDSSSIN